MSIAVYGIGYKCVACIGVVVGLWDFGDFCSCGVFVSVRFVPAVCLYDKAPACVRGGGLQAGNLLPGRVVRLGGCCEPVSLFLWAVLAVIPMDVFVVTVNYALCDLGRIYTEFVQVFVFGL